MRLPTIYQPVGFLAGPTASGKSALAIELAKRHNLAIVSADSMQVYRGMAIGTGAVTAPEQQGVPHYMIGIADPRDEFHAARFVTGLRSATNHEWTEEGRRCLVVGGTGMWIQAAREGLFEGPGRNDAVRARLRDDLAAQGSAELHRRLSLVDEESARRLAPADHVRIIRALEVFELTGKPLSLWQDEDRARRAALGELPPLVVLDPPRELLNERIAVRVDAMLAAGWLEEARTLHALNLPDHAPPKKALGYRELFRVIEGEITLPQARELIITGTRQFARRQRVWFKAQRDARLVWPPSIDHLNDLIFGERSSDR
ncbi:MAG TPA: tRNA (adenosine(37)-N6)-dimethylallyltransferase MiaA [Candidatus Sumerlaeota bacterium]|nr:tRNA (adenosine(37)-N6)-dimethylallyltransferase MiaA [Candidatus Sumerlaeota bacterium]